MSSDPIERPVEDDDLDAILPVTDEVREGVLMERLAGLYSPLGPAGLVLLAIIVILRQLRIAVIELLLVVWHRIRRRPHGGAARS